jgi:serine protease inhibitor
MKPFIAIGLVFLLAGSQIVGISRPAQQQTTTSSKFAFKLYNQVLKQNTDTNVFVSPSSVSLALAMTYNGAEGRTREAMARVMEIEGLNLNEVNSAFADLQRPPESADPKVQLKIANSLWAKQGITLKPDFLERARQHYQAKATSLDFQSPAAPMAINSWVKEKTDNLIDKIVDQIKPEAILFLINAIYFKGQWTTEFEKEKTKPDQFQLALGQQKEVQMMSQSGTYFYFEGKDFQAVNLQYGTRRFSMYLFLPGKETTLNDFHKNLTSADWETWMNSFRITPGTVMLPRFKIEYEVKLNDTLKALGMAEAFDPAVADFSGMAKLMQGERIYISEVKHKTFVEVNEEGTKAAAVTRVTGALTSVSVPPKPFVMKVDRPFFFAIRDNATGALLFMGSIVDPQ